MGKYINHAAKGANLIIFPPIYAKGRMWAGFMCIWSIEEPQTIKAYLQEINLFWRPRIVSLKPQIFIKNMVG